MSELQGTISESQDTCDHVDQVLAQWSEARPQLDVTPAAVVLRLGRATAYVDSRVNERLADFGLTRASWDVLASLMRSGPPYRLSPTDLYLAHMRSSGAMTHRLAALERSGLVRRVDNPADARGMLVELTVKGRHLVDRVAPAHMENERELLSPLDDAEQAALAALLRKLLVALEQEQPVPPSSGVGGRPRSRHRK